VYNRFFWLLVFAIVATPVVEAAPVAVPGSTSVLTVNLVPIDTATRSVGNGHAVADFGAVTANHSTSRARSIVIRRRVAVRLDHSLGTTPSARLSVALTSDMQGSTVRVDGVPLSTIPRMIDPVHRIGTAVVHEIEITIPNSVPAGAFHNDLQWTAQSD
jgi:hypothetical protein